MHHAIGALSCPIWVKNDVALATVACHDGRFISFALANDRRIEARTPDEFGRYTGRITVINEDHAFMVSFRFHFTCTSAQRVNRPHRRRMS